MAPLEESQRGRDRKLLDLPDGTKMGDNACKTHENHYSVWRALGSDGGTKGDRVVEERCVASVGGGSVVNMALLWVQSYMELGFYVEEEYFIEKRGSY
jgi:hypothetical protein